MVNFLFIYFWSHREKKFDLLCFALLKYQIDTNSNAINKYIYKHVSIFLCYIKKNNLFLKISVYCKSRNTKLWKFNKKIETWKMLRLFCWTLRVETTIHSLFVLNESKTRIETIKKNLLQILGKLCLMFYWNKNILLLQIWRRLMNLLKVFGSLNTNDE